MFGLSYLLLADDASNVFIFITMIDLGIAKTIVDFH